MNSTLLLTLFMFAIASQNRGGLTTSIEEQSFKASLKEGYHFNLEAPNKVIIDGNTIPSVHIKGRKAEFSPLPDTWTSGKAALYVCDDAVTFCEPNFVTLKGTATDEQIITDNPKMGLINSDGFIEDDLNKALELAKQQKKLVLIDFSARWCPGCVRFENETFHTTDFKDLTANFVKVKIDLDRFENQILSKKFNINAIPTLLVVNSKQQEVDRLIDYQPFSVLRPFFKTVQDYPQAISELMKNANKNEAARDLLAKRLVMAGRFKESLKYFSQRHPPLPEYLYAKVKTAAVEYKEDNSQKNIYIRTLREAILQEPNSSRSIVWRTDLISLLNDPVEIRKIAEDGNALADRLLKDPKLLLQAVQNDMVGEYTNYESFLVAIERAELIEMAQPNSNESRDAWNLAAKIGKNLKIPPTQSGPALRYLVVLVSSKNFQEADKYSQELLKLQPTNGDLERRRIRILVELKKYNEAILLGKSALANSYGRNEFWVAEVLAKAYVQNKNYKEAKDLIDQYLSRTDADWTHLQSTRKALEDLQQQIPKTI